MAMTGAPCAPLPPPGSLSPDSAGSALAAPQEAGRVQTVAECQKSREPGLPGGLAQSVPSTLYSFSKALPKYRILIISPGMVGWLVRPPPPSSHVGLLTPGALGM